LPGEFEVPAALTMSFPLAVVSIFSGRKKLDRQKIAIIVIVKALFIAIIC
jgi:hypothetical protein